MGELVQIRHDGELADEDDAMEGCNVVTAATAASVEATKHQLRLRDAVCLRQLSVQLAELLLALFDRSRPRA